MDRRELLGAMGATAVGLIATGAMAAPGDEHHHHMDKTHEDCLKSCNDCAKACNMMAHHCLDKLANNEGPAKEHARAHSLAADCAEFCSLSATMIARSSQLMRQSCEACADACRLCAEACESSSDSAMKACAKVCRECETSCKAMVRVMKASA